MVVNLEALTKLKRFVDRIDTLHLSNISDANEWAQWLDNFFETPTWKENLHVDFVLSNFGFSPALASSIGQTPALPRRVLHTQASATTSWMPYNNSQTMGVNRSLRA